MQPGGDIAEYLGHGDPGFTLRLYTHMLPPSHERAPAQHQPAVTVDWTPTDAYSLATTTGGYRSTHVMNHTTGRVIGVDDPDLVQAQDGLAGQGIWQELSGVASVAGLRTALKQGDTFNGPVVCICTSTGLQDKNALRYESLDTPRLAHPLHPPPRLVLHNTPHKLMERSATDTRTCAHAARRSAVAPPVCGVRIRGPHSAPGQASGIGRRTPHRRSHHWPSWKIAGSPALTRML
jgi:hypothetical protein